ncbi:hypothetical protein [Amycolatopsis sp. GM8]|uniref:hypothetical protein n=1 Tax=Amycolatopsis sp. GM8 TaxID=2896530 RepID=UPI001F225CA9|nr:hypothetical protein [Amycolatopsis sp. GM8]
MPNYDGIAATRELQRLGHYLLGMGQSALLEGGIQRADLDAAIDTVEVITEDRNNPRVVSPGLRELIPVQLDQLRAVRQALVADTPAVRQDTPEYLAILAALDAVVAAAASLSAVLDFNLVHTMPNTPCTP